MVRPVNRRRREFLIHNSRVALGFSMAALDACSISGRKAPRPGAVSLESLTASWAEGIPRWLQETKMPAVSIAIIRHGELVWRRGFGVKDIGTGEPADGETVFAACSLTKPVFAYAVLKLCEKGVMGLDTPLTRYTSRRILGDPRLDLITARHVLNHTTGFPNWRNDKEPFAIQFTPGARFQYSGEGFSYLQSIVEEVTRQPFENFMRANILTPFGMTSSQFGWDLAYAHRIAKPHDQAGKRIARSYETPPSTSQRRENLARYGAAASLLTTPTDYAKFVLEIINPKPADAFRLSEKSRKELLRAQVKIDDHQSESLGWVIYRPKPGVTAFTHAGQDSGYYCLVNASAETKSGVIVMMNGDNYEAFLAKLGNDQRFADWLFSL
jgi:CubicO group peptidase (beta-lactamase class C family)